MAPEQAAGETQAIGPACDVYGVGVVLYEMLTGRVPFQGYVRELLAQILTREPTPPSQLRPDLDTRLEVICCKAMAKKVADRYASMSELAAALRDYRPGQCPRQSVTEMRQDDRPAGRAAASSPSATQSATEMRQDDRPGDVGFTLHIDRDFGSFTDDDQDQILSAIKSLLQISRAVTVISKRSGSVFLTIRLSREEAEQLLQAIKSGALREYRVIGCEIEDLPVLDTPHHGKSTRKVWVTVLGAVLLAVVGIVALQTGLSRSRPGGNSKGNTGEPLYEAREGKTEQNPVVGEPVTNTIGMELIPIKAGKFLMGSPHSEVGRADDEDLHEVTLTHDFYLGKHLVTQQQYRAITGENPSQFSPTEADKDEVAELDTSRFPVERVSWEEAVKFCEKLTEKEKGPGASIACRPKRNGSMPAGPARPRPFPSARN